MPEPPPTRTRLAYQPALDGLRAVAIVAVLLYHGGFSWMPGGALGVDLFFVLSGFLITTLLVRELDATGSISLSDFYLRRIRRLFPALVLLLLGVAVYAATTSPSQRAPGLRLDTVASLFYVANWRYIWADRSYFAQFGPPSPLLHVWSLAVEEQWYVFWPPVLLVLWRLARRSRAVLVGFITACAAASVVWMRHVSATVADPSRAYYGTDTRAHTLLAGAGLALLLHRRSLDGVAGRALRAAGALGLAACAWMFLVVSSDSPRLFQGGFALFAVAATAAVAGIMTGRGVLVRVLSVRPVVYVGRISYSLYLWHWLVDVWIAPPRVDLSVWPLFAIRTTLAVAASAASFALVERPVRAAAWDRMRRPRFVTLSGAGAAAVLALLAVWPAGAGGGSATAAAAAWGSAPATGTGDLRVAVYGGSVGWSLARPEQPVESMTMYNLGALGCGLVPGEIMVKGRHIAEEGTPPCSEQEARLSRTLEHNPVDLVLISYGAWEVFDHWQDGRVMAVGSAEYRRMILDSLDRLRDLIRAQTPAPIVFLDAPCMRGDALLLGSGKDNPRNDAHRIRWVNGVLDDWLASNPRVALVRWSRWLCPDGQFLRLRNGTEVRPDGVHLSAASALLAWRWLEPQLQAIQAAGGASGP